jgi:N-carbamoyl-L-amino-acid hydrolase
MRSELVPDITFAARLFDELRARTADGAGVTRDAYGPGEQAAHDMVRAHADALGLETRTDAAGNLLMTLAGRDRGAGRIVIGSHLDSVRQGGNYDGAAGVLAGLAAVTGMRQAGIRPARDVVVLALRAEEAGTWFPTSYPGSHAALGRLPAAALEVRRLDTGQTLAEHMRASGFDPDAVRNGASLLRPETLAAYVEVHIEQGPVLDAEAIAVGVVTGIPGSRRLRSARVIGAYNHSGATPRRYRCDAAIAAAELAYKLDEAWAKLETEGHKVVCTFCTLETTPEAAFTKIAGEARFSLDVRGIDHASIDRVFERMHALTAEIGPRRGVRFELGPETGSRAVLMDAGLREALARAAATAGVHCRAMASGGGHDAAAFAVAGVPAAMLFVRNQNGSHTPEEAMRMEDFAAACSVLTAWLAEAAG